MSDILRGRKSVNDDVLRDYIKEQILKVHPDYNLEPYYEDRRKIRQALHETRFVTSTKGTTCPPSSQSAYNRLASRLRMKQAVEPWMAEAARLVCPNEHFTPGLRTKLYDAGWNPDRVHVPSFTEFERRCTAILITLDDNDGYTSREVKPEQLGDGFDMADIQEYPEPAPHRGLPADMLLTPSPPPSRRDSLVRNSPPPGMARDDQEIKIEDEDANFTSVERRRVEQNPTPASSRRSPSGSSEPDTRRASNSRSDILGHKPTSAKRKNGASDVSIKSESPGIMDAPRAMSIGGQKPPKRSRPNPGGTNPGAAANAALLPQDPFNMRLSRPDANIRPSQSSSMPVRRTTAGLQPSPSATTRAPTQSAWNHRLSRNVSIFGYRRANPSPSHSQSSSVPGLTQSASTAASSQRSAAAGTSQTQRGVPRAASFASGYIPNQYQSSNSMFGTTARNCPGPASTVANTDDFEYEADDVDSQRHGMGDLYSGWAFGSS
ncbi:hypothetical protein QBC34DRAFT_498789 [Podospora aff. communis PSN243]|uniref:J domain-containing protein n=1 Tax=Podospora aff. communis PSN243 TaxID=3040156 RepID=A0AAV9G5Z1_9PEZI|nr:hypothetical protein QBC34DRAFT_498789 [Podospora aff. communis PSN243]